MCYTEVSATTLREKQNNLRRRPLVTTWTQTNEG